MTMRSRILAAVLVAASVPWLAGAAGAAPLSTPLALTNADTSAVETVQYRRYRNRAWIGPALGAGIIIGGALAARPYYYGPDVDAYAYAPGPYVYAPEPYVYAPEPYVYAPEPYVYVRPYRSWGWSPDTDTIGPYRLGPNETWTGDDRD